MSKNYLVTYQDGSKKHVSRAERDDLLLGGLAREIAPDRYIFTGQPKTLHAFSELGALDFGFEPRNLRRRFLPGSFIFEYQGKRRRELLETPEACALRLSTT